MDHAMAALDQGRSAEAEPDERGDDCRASSGTMVPQSTNSKFVSARKFDSDV